MEMYFSKLSGFQTKEDHGNKIPLSAVKLSKVEYEYLMEGQRRGKLILVDETTGRPYLADGPKLSLDETKERKLQDLNVLFEDKVYDLQEGISSFETKSWTDQKNEALAYLTDPNSATPTLSAIATERGMSVMALAEKVVQKANTYAAKYGELLGKRQVLEKSILAATSIKQLDLLKWDGVGITEAVRANRTSTVNMADQEMANVMANSNNGLEALLPLLAGSLSL